MVDKKNIKCYNLFEGKGKFKAVKGWRFIMGKNNNTNQDYLRDSNSEEIIRADGGIDSTLPQFLRESIEAFLIGKEKYESGTGYYQFDMDYCDLQSDINVCEVEQLITSEEAWKLREHYLGLQKA